MLPLAKDFFASLSDWGASGQTDAAIALDRILEFLLLSG